MSARQYYVRHKRVIAVAGVGLLLVFATERWVARGRADAPKYLTARVDQGSITSTVQATGTINPVTASIPRTRRHIWIQSRRFGTNSVLPQAQGALSEVEGRENPMTKRAMSPVLAVLTVALLFAPALFAQRKAWADAKPTDEFFIISSIDATKNELLLKRPTEVTDAMRVDRTTRYIDEKGERIALAALRAGDTVYIVSRPGEGGPVAVEIRKGPITLTQLHKRYLR